MSGKARIAHLAGPNATIQNTPPLVTSNKARAKYGLAPRRNPDGSPQRYDVLRTQRLAKPVTVYVEQFSAHPLEQDAAGLYGPPDGYLDASGAFHAARTSPADRPVYEVELSPDDGYYPLPYMARQADGRAWEEECTDPKAPNEQARQPFFPDGSRSFAEIDQMGIGSDGTGNLISSRAEVDFHRIVPPAGYSAEGERRGVDFFAYKPTHLESGPPRGSLARIANRVRAILDSGDYDGAIWTQGSPRIEETLYWFNLLLDTTRPICGNAAQRVHGMISNDGPKNIVDSVEYITSRIWADDDGRNHAGMVLVAEQRVYAARDVIKGDARPGGFILAGGHGGIIAGVGHETKPRLLYIPASRHTWRSEVNMTRLPASVLGLHGATVPIKDAAGDLLESAIPKVSIVKDGSYYEDEVMAGPEQQVDIIAWLEYSLQHAPLAGFAVEGLSPYGKPASPSRTRALLRAVYSGLPVVQCGRGNTEGFAIPMSPFIAGSNLAVTKARILLMACLMKFGTLPAALDPASPTAAEAAATAAKVAAYQAVFDTH
ncbi:MAG: asparaginase domain-containing protein [Acetobacteraceae bacterium]